jgi:hypothetical protein
LTHDKKGGFVKQFLLSLFVPPFAACRYGCAGCCAAPIGVFWIAGITGIIYGLVGGPTNRFGVDWEFVGLGVPPGWWPRSGRGSPLPAPTPTSARARPAPCAARSCPVDESDPFDEIRKAR